MSTINLKQIQEDTKAAIEVERAKALCATITPEIARGLAANVDWLMRNIVSDLQFADGDEETVDITLDMQAAQKMPASLATTAKALVEYAELLEVLDKARAA